MARIFGLLLVGLALLAVGGSAKGDPLTTVQNLKAGDWCFSFVPETGMNLSYKGVNLIRSSTLVVHNGQYTSAYLSYTVGTTTISVHDIKDGKEVELQHQSEGFTGVQTISLLPNKAIFQFNYGMAPNITNGRMDYCLGYLSSQPFAGGAYSLKGTKGETSGIIPLKAKEVNKNYAPDLFREAHFDSNLGKLDIKIDGDLEGLELLEFRGISVPMARRAPELWAGIFQKPLEAGRRYSQSVTFSIDPAPVPARPSRLPAEAKVKVAPCREAQVTPGGELRIIPEPKEIHALNGYFTLTPDTKIVVANNATERDFSGAQQFSSEVAALYGVHLKTVRESQVGNAKHLILVGELARNKMLAKAARSEGIIPPAKSEGYALKITPSRVLVVGYDAAGSFYGMQSLRQLVLPDAKAPKLHACRVNDWPALKFRGILLYTGNEALPFHRKLIDRLLTKYKYNAVFLECSAIQWKTNPRMAPTYAMSQEDLKKDIAYARKNFLEVIPEVSTLGHFGWAFTNQQNLNLAEDPKVHYAYCPSKKESYDFIFSIFDEAIKLFDHPRYFHIGHDEVANFGKFPACPECTRKGMTTLILEDTNKIHDYFASKGIRVMMWSDMLLAPGEASSATNAPSIEEAKKRRAGLPKDIIIEDWHYFATSVAGYPSPYVFQKDGFEVIAATWYDPRNIANFAQSAKNAKSLGHTLTIWAGYNSNESNLEKEKHQFTAIVTAGDYAWNSSKTPGETIPYKQEEIFDQAFYQKPPVLINHDGFTVDMRGFYNIKLTDNPKGSGWIGLGPEYDLSAAPTGSCMLKGVKFQLADATSANSALRVASSFDPEAIYPEKVSIPLNTQAKSLLFLQTTARNDDLDAQIGTYRIHYADGTQIDVPVVYGKNVAAWNDTRFCADSDVLWAGDSKGGDRVVLRAQEWKNPEPKKSIASVEVISANTEAGLALLGITGTR